MLVLVLSSFHMSDPHEEPDWEFTRPQIESAEPQQQQQQQHEQEADIIALSGSSDQPHSFSSSDLALTDYFPDIFFQTFPPVVTRTSVGLSIREPEQSTPAPALEFGQSSKGKRKAGDIEPPQAVVLVVTTQSEEITEERARELEREEESGRQRRVRSTEVHNINERRRRGRITEKIQALGNLIPRCKKTEIASILDEAILYIRALKLQTEIMSMNTDPLQQQQQQCFPYIPPYLPLPMTHWLGHHPMFALPSPTFNYPPEAASYRPMPRPASFPFFQPQITSFILHQQLLGMSESSSAAALGRSFSCPASVSEQISQLPITPIQQQLLGMSSSPSEAAAAAARSISFSASVSEQIFAFNQPQFGESSSRDIRRLASSSHSLPIIRQGTLPFSTSYTVHATHVIPPTNPDLPHFDDEADCSKSDG